MNTLHSVILIAVMSAVVIFLRSVPFLIFRGKETPEIINYLGRFLPYAIMGMLLVYCLKSTPIVAAPHGLPELIAIGITVAMQLWKKNSLLSSLIGTVSYMLLVQIVFA